MRDLPGRDTTAGEALEATVARLRAELAGLRRAMRNRAVIEQAKGVLAARLNLDPEQAFDHLLRLSQDTNTKVAVVAATVVGTATPDPALPEPAVLVEDDLRTRLAQIRDASGLDQTPGPPRVRPPVAEALHTYHQIIAARIAAARTLDELAGALAVATRGWPAPQKVVLAVLEPDGVLRLAGSHGLSADERSQWARMPPQADIPMTRAVRQRAAVVLAEPAAIKHESPSLAELPQPPQAAVAMPLLREDRIVGGVAMRWSTPVDLSPEAERYLRAVARPVASRMVELNAAPAAGSPDTAVPASSSAWLPIALDAMHDPAVLLAPCPDGGRVVDFRVAHANVHAQELLRQADIDAGDGTLLSLFPYAGSRVLLAICGDVLRNGGLRDLDHIPVAATDLGGRGTDSISARVTRVEDQVLLVWHPRTAAELIHAQMLRAERIAQVGSFRWDLPTGTVQLSPYLRHLLRRGRDEQLDLDALSGVVHEQDRAAARRAVRAMIMGGESVSLDFRGTGRLAGRFLRVNAESVGDRSGNPAAVMGTVQDVTDERLLQARLRETELALAEQRHTAELRSSLAEAMLPAPRPLDGKHVTARGAAHHGRGGGRAAGVWYDVCELPGGDVLLMVGGAIAEGTAATVGAGRVRHAVRSYALVHAGPAQILGSANRLVCFDRPGLAASVVLARYTPGLQRLRWAAAGQAAPVRYTGDAEGSVLSGPAGLPLGASPGAGYDETTTTLAAGDRLLLVTEGLLQGSRVPVPQVLRSLTGAAAYAQPETVHGLIEHLVRTVDGVHGQEFSAVLARISGG